MKSFIICTLDLILLWEVKVVEMYGACSTHRKDEKCIYRAYTKEWCGIKSE
jgi:hypothetical protein